MDWKMNPLFKPNMKYLILLLLLSSCYVSKKDITITKYLEVFEIEPFENGACKYHIRGEKGSKIRRHIVIVDTIGRYKMGHQFRLINK